MHSTQSLNGPLESGALYKAPFPAICTAMHESCPRRKELVQECLAGLNQLVFERLGLLSEEVPLSSPH